MVRRPVARGCVLRALWIYCCFVAGTAGLALIVGYALSWWRWRSEDAAWAEHGAPLERFASEHPATKDSPAALRLDELTRAIGIESIPGYKVPDRRAVEMAKDPALKAIQAHLRAIETLRADGPVPTMPAEVRAYMQANATALDLIEDHLIASRPLVFEENVAMGAGSPIPTLLGIRSLQGVLLVRAGDALRRQDAVRANRSLEASWVHAQSCHGRSELISQLIGIAVAGMQNSILRLWAAPPAVWLDRVKTNDFKARVLASYQAEVYGWRAFARRYKGAGDISEMDGAAPRANTLFDHAFRFVSTPYIRLSLAGVSEVMRRSREELESGDPCSFDPDKSDETIRSRFPRWNILGPIAVPSLFRVWASVRDVSLDSELTGLVMQAHLRPRENPAPGTATLSRVCTGYAWVHGKAAAGRLSIRLEPTEMPAPRKEPWTFLLAVP
jgi:hypothetical protein